MASTIVPAILAVPSYMLSTTVFEELPPLPEYVPFSPSSPVIPSVIAIPDDPEVTKETVFVSEEPLLAFSSR